MGQGRAALAVCAGHEPEQGGAVAGGEAGGGADDSAGKPVKDSGAGRNLRELNSDSEYAVQKIPDHLRKDLAAREQAKEAVEPRSFDFSEAKPPQQRLAQRNKNTKSMKTSSPAASYRQANAAEEKRAAHGTSAQSTVTDNYTHTNNVPAHLRKYGAAFPDLVL